ncbi:MAG: phage shock protein PspA [Verrucomicrobiota bacterium JB022]|nr:phage shock protein PspA [Verrucomicrobiota bacterium JB022]
MSIFSRFQDIIRANLNSMLEKAEDPEKLIKLMIQEMEDTLVDLKASCAGAMAQQAQVMRLRNQAQERAERWAEKATLALDKGREDLAREALVEKRTFQAEADNREAEVSNFDEIIAKYREDINQLEEKLESARNKHRVLIQRAFQAKRRQDAQTKIRYADSSDAVARFDHFENRIERLEAENELINPKRTRSLDDEFAKLEHDDAIEQELQALKAKKAGNPSSEA